MSADQLRIYARASKILEKTFKELGELFESAESNNAGGARHKIKAAEKEASQQVANQGLLAQAQTSSAQDAQTKSSPSKQPSKKETKESKKKPVPVDANGNELKRPLSAYMLYNNHRRPTLRKEHPELSLPDLSKLIGDEWKTLSDAQRDHWKEKAKEARLEYDMKTYNFLKKSTVEDQALPATQKDEVEQPKAAAEAKGKQAASALQAAGPGHDSLSPFTSDEEKPVQAKETAAGTAALNNGTPAKAQKAKESSSDDL